MSPGRPSRQQIRRRRRGAALLFIGLGGAVAYLLLRATILAPIDTHGASVHRFAIDSKAVGRSLDVGVVVPGGDGPSHRPLLVFLHGKGGTVDSFVGDGWFRGDEPFFAALAKLGTNAPVVAFPEDDGDSYWHDRDTGGWGTYVMDEVIPAVERRFGTAPRRVAIGGISMGGFGAYALALEHPGAFCAIGGHSPALWLEGAASAPGAFDETLEAAGADVSAHSWPGEHERAYWDAHWNAYLRFYAEALRDCR